MLEEQFATDAKAFARQHSMLPANAPAGYEAQEGTALGGLFTGFRHSAVPVGARVAKISMTHGPSNRGRLVLVSPSLAGAGLPVYFLPWDARGAAVELAIPNKDPGLPEPQHPRFFFTAVLSGCTIFFKGSARRPVVYHCGTAGAGGGGTPTAGDSNAFFRRLLLTCRNLGITARAGGQLHSVKSTEYMRTRDGKMSTDLEDLSDEVVQRLDRYFGDRAVIEQVEMWGAVFGERTGRDWVFYLQNNATVMYKTWQDVVKERIARKKLLGGLIRWKAKEKYTTREQVTLAKAKPVALRQVFPGGGRTTKTLTSLRTLI